MIFNFKHSILAFAAVIHLDITNAQLCPGDNDILSHNVEFDARITCEPEDPDTYLKLEFASNAGPYADLVEGGWCVDYDRVIYCNKSYKFDSYSSFDDIPSSAVDKPENLGYINYLINTHPIGSALTIPGCWDDDLRMEEYQTAIWGLIDNNNHAATSFSNVQSCVVEYLQGEATTVGANWEVTCDHDTIGIIVVVDDENEFILNQVLMAEVAIADIPGICECSPSLPPTPPEGNPNVSGDPHIRTWSGKLYDFHGICDLVLLQNPSFENDLGLDIHVRTKQLKQFSYVSSAALRIGNDILEVTGDDYENMHWINKHGNKNENNGIIGVINGYPISHNKVNSNQHTFTVELGGNITITMKTFKKIVRVDIKGATEESFGGSLGLLGSYGSGKMIARNKSTIIEDADTFGAEWQVLPFEDKLFHSVEGPQAPEKCDIPMASILRRRLAESNMSEEKAKIACARVNSMDFDMCVFDVMATGDKDVAGAY